MATKASWTNMQHLYVNRSSDSLNSDCSKENLSPVFSIKQPPVSSLTSSIPTKKSREEENEERERKIDSEIEEIEKEISRLSTRLEALRIEKAEKIARQTVEKKRGRVIFPESKQSAKVLNPEKKIESKPDCRGVSLGPCEILAGFGHRSAGVSLGMSEIITGIRSNHPGKPELTPIQQTQNRRKSCFWKLPEIDEGKIIKGRGRKDNLSVSPKSRKNITILKQAFTTVGSKRPVKKDDSVLGSVQPRKLFPASEKKPVLKAGRVIASRYNQTSNGNSISNVGRKRSFPEEENEKKGKASTCRSKGTEMMSTTKVKKRWEIPSIDNDKEHHVVLPEIKMMKNEDSSSRRDSGPAKRVGDLIGRRSFFCDEGEDLLVCQELDEGGLNEF